MKPEICPVLSLGLYLLCFPFSPNGIKLFPGRNQYERFLVKVDKWLKIKEVLFSRGVDPDDIGTHSMRKGAAAFCSSGSTA